MSIQSILSAVGLAIRAGGVSKDQLRQDAAPLPLRPAASQPKSIDLVQDVQDELKLSAQAQSLSRGADVAVFKEVADSNTRAARSALSEFELGAISFDIPTPPTVVTLLPSKVQLEGLI